MSDCNSKVLKLGIPAGSLQEATAAAVSACGVQHQVSIAELLPDDRRPRNRVHVDPRSRDGRGTSKRVSSTPASQDSIGFKRRMPMSPKSVS